MNYIWDILLKADKEGIKKENLKFKPARVFSPYMEVSFENLNTSGLENESIVEINPYYRFHEIFKDLLDINLEESQSFREELFDIIVHYLGELDLKQGLCKQEFYKKFILRDIADKVYGREIAENINIFNEEELDFLLSGLITLYVTGTSLKLLKKIMRKVFPKNSIYQNQDNRKNLLIYLGAIKTEKLKRKIDMIIDMFLPINTEVDLYWDKHFGIMGVEATMVINEIVIN